MNKWFFSNNNEITGPLNLADSNKFIASEPDAYAWHPSYEHWVPASCIEEFQIALTPPPAPGDVPKELIEDFIDKEKELITMLERIDNTLASTMQTLPELNLDIDSYTGKTKQLNEEVKATILNVEQQMAALQKNLANFANKDLY